MSDAPTKNLPGSILYTLSYADVFDYPLTAQEVYRYLINQRASIEVVSQALGEMVESHSIASVDEYFTLPNRESIVEIRKRRAATASRLWKKAVRYGRIVASLPFVRMVAVTGSLAMNNTDEGRDMDYLLVTAPNHLWTCRALTLLIARFAKLEGVSICPNYLLTTNALELEEHSLYAAHELAQMIPLSGMEIYEEIRRLNEWMDEYLPNADSCVIANPAGAKQSLRAGIQSIFEFIFDLPPMRLLERWEMNRKIKKLTREQSSSSESRFSKDVCKGHVDSHGEKTEEALKDRLERLAPSYLFYAQDVNVS